MYIFKLSYLSLLLVLAGCGSSIFAPPGTNPIIEDTVGNVGTLATTSNRRLVLINKKNDRYCAESSPDSVASYASLFSAGASANVTGQGSGNVNLANSLALSSTIISKRSQGLQFYRDGVFAYCQAFQNGYIDHREYRQAMWRLRQETIKLARFEIGRQNWNNKPEIVVIPAPTPPALPAPTPPLEPTN